MVVLGPRPMLSTLHMYRSSQYVRRTIHITLSFPLPKFHRTGSDFTNNDLDQFFYFFPSMSTPYSLAEAFELLKRRQERSKSDRELTIAIDILGIVSNISNAVHLPGQSRVRKCQIWLVDESLDDSASSDSRQKAIAGSRFVLYESSEIARVVNENIKAGDILRFNRVTVKSFRGSSQFQFSSMDPEPGLSWFRLGSVYEPAIYSTLDSHESSESSIPKSMLTSRVRVVELADWYKKTRTSRLAPSAPSALPTRKRRLDEIQSSVGLLSHVTVRVTCVRTHSAALQTNTIQRPNQGGSKRQRTPIVFASFVDDSGAAMTFIDSSGRFLAQLNNAQTKSHTARLVMTNVSTDHRSNFLEFTTSANEIVLVPTAASTAQVISEEMISNQSNARRNSVYGFDETQARESSNDTVFVVRSGVTDIHLNGLSLKHTSPSIFSSSSEFLKTIMGKDGNFAKAIICLSKNKEKVGKVGLPATPGVLKTLCGSLDIAELSTDEKLCMHSISFLRALLQEPAILEWTLRQESGSLQIVEAILHRVPN